MNIFNKILKKNPKKFYEEFTLLTVEEAKIYCKNSEKQLVRKTIVDIVTKEPNKTVLEIGCGNGIDAPKYNSEYYTGIDISKSLTKVARESYPNHIFLTGNAIDYLQTFKNIERKFDFIFAKAILEHLPSEEIALKLFKLMNEIGNTVLVAWHMKPRNKTKIVYQNYYKAKKFQMPNLNIRKMDVENYELWIVTKI
jgi:ubiquinone/menaquinone biosynthesis C-methylase UbiE